MSILTRSYQASADSFKLFAIEKKKNLRLIRNMWEHFLAHVRAHALYARVSRSRGLRRFKNIPRLNLNSLSVTFANRSGEHCMQISSEHVTRRIFVLVVW
jgi:hypothetical protein